MIDKEVIKEKFQELNRYLKELEDFQSISWKEFSSSLANFPLSPGGRGLG